MPIARAGARRSGGVWQASRLVLRMRLFVGLVLLDLAAIVAGFFAGTLLYPPFRWPAALDVVITVMPLHLLSAFASNAYASELINRPLRGAACGVRAFLLALAAVLFVAFYLKSTSELSRAGLAISASCAVVLLGALRTVFLRRARSIVGGNPYSVVYISGGGPLPLDRCYSTILSSDAFEPDHHDPAMYDRLAESLRNADRVVVGADVRNRDAWINALRGANVQAEVVMPELAAIVPQGMARFDGLPTIVVARGPLSTRDRALKRGFDLVLATGLLVVLAPFLLLVAVAIRIDTPGPVLFRQTRIGRGNRIFNMLKFRSMRVERSDADGAASTARDDDRVTRVGAFIRRTSIDELPQLVNVLAGTMSIVGPRPHALGSRASAKLFWEIDGRYWHRHAAKPGLTGLAQVRGFRGATVIEQDLIDRLRSDLEYLNGWTIWRDVVILVKTLGVLRHHNAF